MRTAVSRCLLGVGALFASLALPTEATATQYYDVLMNVWTEQCIDVPGLYTGNTLVQQYPCNYGHNQFWTLVPTQYPGWYFIEALHSGKCLEVPGWYTTNGAKLQHYTCNGGTNQMWWVDDVGFGESAYINGFSGKCIDIAGGTSSAGYHVQQFDCHYGPNQRFQDGLYGVAVSE